MSQEIVLVCHSFLPDGTLPAWQREFASCRFVDGRRAEDFARHLGEATIAYGLPDLGRLAEMSKLRWIQLASAGVPGPLCPPAAERGLQVTNLAGLYGPTIAEHALTMLLTLSRNLHVVQRNQRERKWDRSVAETMRDLHGRTLGIVGLGNIGQNIARLAQAFGMRVVGVRRNCRPTPFTDRVFDTSELHLLAVEADHIAVAAPLTRETEGMLTTEFFRALRPGGIYINVSRGTVAQEIALLEALDAGRLAGAGLDVFAVEPLPPDHAFWSHPNVLVSPHYSGETVNLSSLPAERFARNLRNWLGGAELEGNVKLDCGY